MALPTAQAWRDAATVAWSSQPMRSARARQRRAPSVPPPPPVGRGAGAGAARLPPPPPPRPWRTPAAAPGRAPAAPPAADVELSFRAEGLAALTVAHRPAPADAAGIASLAALYFFYAELPARVDAAAAAAAAAHPAAPGGSGAGGGDSLGRLLALCAAVAPRAAAAVEAEMLQELARGPGAEGDGEQRKEGGAAEEEDDFRAGLRLVTAGRGRRWAAWRARLRRALLEWHEASSAAAGGGAPPRAAPGVPAKLRLTCAAQTSAGTPLAAEMRVVAAGPLVDDVRRRGPDALALPPGWVARVLAAAGGEGAAALAELTAQCWRFQGLGPPARFAVALPPVPAAADGAAFEFEGTGRELATAQLALATLLGGDFGDAGGGAWFPADGRVAFQLRRDAARVRVRDGGGGERVAELPPRQLWALVDCVDAYRAAHPRACPPLALPPPAAAPPAWRRALEAAAGAAGAPLRRLRRRGASGAQAAAP